MTPAAPIEPATPAGVVLAGGAGRRMPGGKATAVLAGETLLARAVELVRAAGLRPVISARPDAALPPTDTVVWQEPPGGEPHPLRGIAHAVRRAASPIVVVPVDLPLLPPAALRQLADAPGSAVLAHDGRPAALVARITPDLADPLDAAADAGAPALGTLVTLGARLVEIGAVTGAPERALLNVNDPAALAEAERLLALG